MLTSVASTAGAKEKTELETDSVFTSFNSSLDVEELQTIAELDVEVVCSQICTSRT